MAARKIRLHSKVLDLSILVVLLTICILERATHTLLGCSNHKVQARTGRTEGIVIAYIVAGIGSRRHEVASMYV